MKYTAQVDKTFHLTVTVHASSPEDAERLARNDARMRMFHDEQPVITVKSVQEAP